MSADPFTLLHNSGYGAAASGLCNIFFFPGHKTYQGQKLIECAANLKAFGPLKGFQLEKKC